MTSPYTQFNLSKLEMSFDRFLFEFDQSIRKLKELGDQMKLHPEWALINSKGIDYSPIVLVARVRTGIMHLPDDACRAAVLIGLSDDAFDRIMVATGCIVDGRIPTGPIEPVLTTDLEKLRNCTMNALNTTEVPVC